MQTPSTPKYAHGVTHTRPIQAGGRHISEAANEPDHLTGLPIVNGTGEYSAGWARADARYWRAMSVARGECPECGERHGRHEDGCPNAPEQEEA